MFLYILHLLMGCSSDSTSEPQKTVDFSIQELSISAYLSEHIPNVINVDIDMGNQIGDVWIMAQTEMGERNTTTYNIDGKGKIPILGLPPSSQVELPGRHPQLRSCHQTRTNLDLCMRIRLLL